MGLGETWVLGKNNARSYNINCCLLLVGVYYTAGGLRFAGQCYLGEDVRVCVCV